MTVNESDKYTTINKKDWTKATNSGKTQNSVKQFKQTMNDILIQLFTHDFTRTTEGHHNYTISDNANIYEHWQHRTTSKKEIKERVNILSNTPTSSSTKNSFKGFLFGRWAHKPQKENINWRNAYEQVTTMLIRLSQFSDLWIRNHNLHICQVLCSRIHKQQFHLVKGVPQWVNSFFTLLFTIL